jgi:hypothetical protein
VQKKLQETMATKELEDALAGVNLTTEEDKYMDNRSDVSMEQMIADEVISIASSAAAMDRQELEQRVVALETELMRANARAAPAAVRAPTAAEIRNQARHDTTLTATTGIAGIITSMDTYTVWWVQQWMIGAKLRSLRTATLTPHSMRRFSVPIRTGCASSVRGRRRG